MVKYSSDAWAKCKDLKSSGAEITDANHIGNLNPFRYRGYYYDTETKLYYLQSRYYDPEIGRFITIDDISYLDPDAINGLNLYAYCGNNPVIMVDTSGNFAISTILIGCLIAFGVGTTASVVSQGLQYGWGNISIAQALIDGLFAAASVVLAASSISLIASIGIGAAMSFSQYAIGSAIHGESLTLEGTIISLVLGGAGGAISGAGAKSISTAKTIYENMSGRAAQGVKALVTTVQKYGLGSKQLSLVQNLYKNAIQTALNQGTRQAFTQGVIKIGIYTATLPVINYLVNKIPF